MASYPWASSFMAYAFPCCDCGSPCYYTVSAVADSAANAETYLTDNTKECVVDFDALASGSRTISATVAGQLITVIGSFTDWLGYDGGAVFRIYASGAGTLQTTFSASGDGTLSNNSSLAVYDETAAANCSESSGDFTLPQAGYYLVSMSVDGNSGPPYEGNNTGEFTFNITGCDVDIKYCLVEVDWTDGVDSGTVTCTP